MQGACQEYDRCMRRCFTPILLFLARILWSPNEEGQPRYLILMKDELSLAQIQSPSTCKMSLNCVALLTCA